MLDLFVTQLDEQIPDHGIGDTRQREVVEVVGLLLGVGGSNLAPATQQDLFGFGDSTVDEIRDKFGSGSLGRARTLDRD